MKAQTFILILLISIAQLCLGQNCDTLSQDIVNQYNSYSQKQFNKLKRKKDLDGLTAFNVATYLRHKKDTANIEWYELSIKILKGTYRGRQYQDRASKPCPLFKIGLAYYFLDDFQNANQWFIKAIKAQCLDTCLQYYYTKTIMHSSNDTTNWQTLIDTAHFTVIKSVSEFDPLLLYKFPEWKTMSDPGGAFNPTDNGGGPRKRLYFAAKYHNYWIVSHEHGGRGYHTDCLFIEIKPHKTVIVSETNKEFKTFEDLKAFWSKQNLQLFEWDGYDY